MEFPVGEKGQNWVEFWEEQYLKRIEHHLFIEKEKMLDAFKTKELIRGDWEQFKGNESISDFNRGAERIFFWLFSQFGEPNSSPIGSDLFFETYNSYVHIDIKTVSLANRGDYRNIFLSQNQTSYSCDINVKGARNGEARVEEFRACLPHFYSKRIQEGTISRKVCLTYIISILHDSENFEVHKIDLICVPNGSLKNLYGNEVFKAGKNPNSGTVRLNSEHCKSFITLGKPRSIIVYESDWYKQELNHDNVCRSIKSYKEK